MVSSSCAGFSNGQQFLEFSPWTKHGSPSPTNQALKDRIMSKLNAIVIASTLLFVAATQAAPATAAEAHQAQTAQAMRTEGVDHLIPAGRDAVAAPIRSAVAKPAARTERADTKPAPGRHPGRRRRPARRQPRPGHRRAEARPRGRRARVPCRRTRLCVGAAASQQGRGPGHPSGLAAGRHAALNPGPMAERDSCALPSPA